ncbi:LapA family protein [Streptomyces sp. NPDC091371]|uniref:LapA family protein n=1 Tax=Streptomyces sp. NPDC091371 TaxID=3155303 RepID=UPI0034376EAB
MTSHTAKGGTGLHGLLTPGRIAIAVLAVLTLVFIFENTRSTTIRLWIPQVTMPLYVALLIAAVLGGLCGAYFSRRRR